MKMFICNYRKCSKSQQKTTTIFHTTEDTSVATVPTKFQCFGSVSFLKLLLLEAVAVW